MRAWRPGKLPEGRYIWIRELYYRKAEDTNRLVMVKGLGKGSDFILKNIRVPLKQQSASFLAPGTGFMEDSFSTDGGWGGWFRK